MGFAELRLKRIYTTSIDDLSKDFFQPLLMNSKLYDRGVGFFSSGWLRANSEGMFDFATNGGYARWVTSPILSEDDWKHLCLGELARQDDIVYEIIEQSIINLLDSLGRDTLNALSWLIADRVIDFKLALPRNNLSDEFHDKFGIFTDSQGLKVAFSGSYNDSMQGLRNYESLTVFESERDHDKEVVTLQQERFNKLWNNQDPNVATYLLSDSIKLKIAKLRPHERPYHKNPRHPDQGIGESSTIEPHIPGDFAIRDYQFEAYSAWVNNNYQGFFEMATGTGKTYTSLFSAAKVYEDFGSLALIIAVPYIHLADQWEEDARKFNFLPIMAYGSSKDWKDTLSNRVMSFNQGDTKTLCVITTHTTFVSKNFNDVIKGLKGNAMVIADEAHHLGTETARRAYPTQITKRLALSATPSRWFDDLGTKIMIDYFGPTVYSFSLDRAISDGFLTKYFYNPIVVDLTDDEIIAYDELSKKILPLFYKKNRSRKDEEILQNLLIKRSNLLKNAGNKYQAFDDLLTNLVSIQHAICYASSQQKDNLIHILGNEHGIPTHQFTYVEGRGLRQEILHDFDQGILNCIVAIKCLDEGVDVPSTKMAFFLANSTNPREFIQRRGRVLRNSPGKDYAYLYDFIVVPSRSNDLSVRDLSRSILRKELSRFSLFAKNAENKYQSLAVIWTIAKEFNVLDFEE